MKLKLIALAVGLAIGGIGLFAFTNNNDGVGVALPATPALFETSLAAPITSTATSFTLTSNSVRGGGTLSGYSCFTIDEGSAQAEFACGTASGTAVTNVTRGISPSDGQTSIDALKFSHRRGANVKITNFPIIQLLRSQNNGDSTFENVLSYASAVVPSGADQLADVGYVLSVVNGGAVSFDKMIVAGNAGETMATGTLVYLDSSDQEWKKVDTDTNSTFVRVPVGITQGPGVDAGVIGTGVLLMGRDTTQTGMVAGDDYYATSTAGTIDVATTGLLLGRAEDSSTLLFNPVLDITQLDNTFSGVGTFTGSNSFAATTTFSGPVLGVSKLLAVSASVTEIANNTADETEIFTTSLPANTLASGKVVKFRVYIENFSQDTVSAAGATLRLKLGGTTLSTISLGVPGSGFSQGQGFLEGTIISSGSSAQLATLFFNVKKEITDLDAADDSELISLQSGVGTKDSATVMALSATLQWAGASATNDFVPAGVIIELIN